MNASHTEPDPNYSIIDRSIPVISLAEFSLSHPQDFVGYRLLLVSNCPSSCLINPKSEEDDHGLAVDDAVLAMTDV